MNNDQQLIPVRWTCEHFGHTHEWRWPIEEVLPCDATIMLHCESCGHRSARSFYIAASLVDTDA